MKKEGLLWNLKILNDEYESYISIKYIAEFIGIPVVKARRDLLKLYKQDLVQKKYRRGRVFYHIGKAGDNAIADRKINLAEKLRLNFFQRSIRVKNTELSS